MNPQLVINLEKLRKNVQFLTAELKANQLSIMAVTKVHGADAHIVKLFEDFPEITYLGDSRLKNIKSYHQSMKQKVLIRIPMPSEVDEVVQVTDMSFNSEITTIRLLNEAAKKAQKKHRILLMVDLGDLREGIFLESELLNVVGEVVKMAHIELMGLGVNLTCYGAIIPDEENLQQLVAYQQQVRTVFNLELPLISGGNSSSLYLLDDDAHTMPKGITNLRIGEAFFTGGETAHGKQYDLMFDDVLTLQAEIIELKEKPSVPIGQRGIDAFGQVPQFIEKGNRLKGIVALGRQDIVLDGIFPVDVDLALLGASSDHLIIDFTEAKKNYQVGDVVTFKLNYGGMLAAFTSPYVNRVYVGEVT